MKHALMFTGHMIDANGRAIPRFPPARENAAREEIRKYLLKEKAAWDNLIGLASGACGGDILFHELCMEMDIHTEMYLALPVDEFKKKSVSFAGKDWDERFDTLVKKIPVHILPEIKEENGLNVWARTNLWILNTALEYGIENMTLFALWDGKGGDGDGGTEHMVKSVKEKGGSVKIIDINI